MPLYVWIVWFVVKVSTGYKFNQINNIISSERKELYAHDLVKVIIKEG